MQESSTSDFIFTMSQVVSHLSMNRTLLPGTIILTGTPSGIGYARQPPVWLKPGDVLKTTLGGVGSIVNKIV